MRIDDMNFGDVVEHLQEWVDELEVEALKHKQDVARWHRGAGAADILYRDRFVAYEAAARRSALKVEERITRVAGAITVLTDAGKSHE